jgi:hypothetical protein
MNWLNGSAVNLAPCLVGARASSGNRADPRPAGAWQPLPRPSSGPRARADRRRAPRQHLQLLQKGHRHRRRAAKLLNTQSTQQTFENLPADVTVELTVTGVNDAGKGPASEP